MKLSENKKEQNLGEGKEIAFLFVILFLFGCSADNKVALQSPIEPANSIQLTQDNSVEEITPLSEIDLSKIGHIAPIDRVQDKEENQLKVVNDLIANGKDSIPFLISKLEDKTKINEPVLDFWGEIRVGDVAFVILTDFFSGASSHHKETITGVGWNEFLGCTNSDVPAQNCYLDYVEKHGRKTIKSRWQKIWEENKDKIYWDEAERCFKVKAI